MFFLIVLAITTKAYHRQLTSELIIIHIWAVLEIAMIDILYSRAYISHAAAWIYSGLVAISIAASLFCYVVYYRLYEEARYKIGMIPLALAGLCSIVLMMMLLVGW